MLSVLGDAFAALSELCLEAGPGPGAAAKESAAPGDGSARLDRGPASHAPGRESRVIYDHPGAPPTHCPQCSGTLVQAACAIEAICEECGLVQRGDPTESCGGDAPRGAPFAARLRIVGPSSSQLQPDLYRSGSAPTLDAQQKQVLEEYVAFRELHVANGGFSYPTNLLELAAEQYNEIRKQEVKRSQNKRVIMMACLRQACLTAGYCPAKGDLANFMQLPNKGIARGNNFLRSAVADKKIELDVDIDPCLPEVKTLFGQLFGQHATGDVADDIIGGGRRQADRYRPLRDATFEVVQIAISGMLCTNSVLRSQVMGAAFVVLQRCSDRELVPVPFTLQRFCEGRIRKNTVERVIRDLEGYHSRFEKCYHAAGLDATPPGGRGRPSGGPSGRN